jgi:uncharacterized protein (TIGR03435 family)
MNIDFGPGDNFHPTGGYFSGTNQALYTYILFAYKVSGFRELDTLLSQLPDWAKNDRFDIQARVTGDPTKDQLRLMMQSLLADRFKLVMHTEAREGPAYGLVLAKPGKPGPNLQPHSTKIRCSTAPPDNPTPGKEPAPLEAVAGGLPSVCGVIFPTMRPNVPGDAREVARDVTMRRIASEMSGWSTIDRPVIDQTGLNGTFDFTSSGRQKSLPVTTSFASAPVAERDRLTEWGQDSCRRSRSNSASNSSPAKALSKSSSSTTSKDPPSTTPKPPHPRPPRPTSYPHPIPR